MHYTCETVNLLMTSSQLNQLTKQRKFYWSYMQIIEKKSF